MSDVSFPISNHVYEYFYDEHQPIARMKRIYYPISVVDVELIERQSEDFKEIEYMIERLIGTGITYMDELANLMGMPLHQMEKYVALLIGISHVLRDEAGMLRLTTMGQQSVRDERKYLRYPARQKLYCDGITGKLLPKMYYKYVMVEPADIGQTDCLMPRGILPKERLNDIISDAANLHINLVDEVEGISEIYGAETRFLPALLVKQGNMCKAIVKPNHILSEHVKDGDRQFVSKWGFNPDKLNEQPTLLKLNRRQRPLLVLQDGNLSLEVQSSAEFDSPKMLFQLAFSPTDRRFPSFSITYYNNEGRLLFMWTQDKKLQERVVHLRLAQFLNKQYRNSGDLDERHIFQSLKEINAMFASSFSLDHEMLIEQANRMNYSGLSDRLKENRLV